MDIYFTKATYLNNIYKLSDFYSGTTYVQNANKKLSVNLTAHDGITTVVCPSDTLPDATSIRDYTHIMIPSMTKIYEITSFQYVNGDQVRLNLSEDALIGNYEELKTKKLMLSRSNDTGKFLGLNDIKDIAIKHTASVTYGDVPEDTTGFWMLFTFQADAGDIEFEFGDIANYPLVGTYSAMIELTTAFPPVMNTTTPFAYDYFLKFAKVDGDLYQAVYIDDDLLWVQVYESGSYDLYDGGSFVSLRDRAITFSTSQIALTGDVDTINVLLPLDATLVQIVPTNTGNHALSSPSFYHYKGNDQPDKLLSMRLIPQALLGPMTTCDVASLPRLTRVTKSVSSPYYMTGTTTATSYQSKIIVFQNTLLNMTTFSSAAPGWSLPIFTAKQFKTGFTFAQSGITYPTDYEPFKRYYLSFYGSLIEIPARYASNFNVRLGLTATSILFEVYTDRYNIIGSGDLQWFTRFTVDTLALYQANNPTYKEQFWTSQLTGAIRAGGIGAGYGGMQSYKGSVANIGSEFFGGSIQQPIKAGLTGAIGGFAAGMGQAAVGMVGARINMQYMEKGLKDKADQIQGINEVALALIKGFDAYIITVAPEAEALSQMKAALELTGFPVSSSATIATLTAFNVATLGLGASKVVVGKLLETVRNASITMMIDRKLQEGVIII